MQFSREEPQFKLAVWPTHDCISLSSLYLVRSYPQTSHRTLARIFLWSPITSKLPCSQRQPMNARLQFSASSSIWVHQTSLQITVELRRNQTWHRFQNCRWPCPQPSRQMSSSALLRHTCSLLIRISVIVSESELTEVFCADPPRPSCTPLRLCSLMANVRVALRSNVSNVVFGIEAPMAVITAENGDLLEELDAAGGKLISVDAYTVVKDLLHLFYPRTGFAIAFVVSMVLERCVLCLFALLTCD